MSKPVIGAINGPCVTGGFELALACDFLVASEHATFGDTHARVGVMPAGGMSVFLPRVVGVRKAKEMSLSGNFVGVPGAWFLWYRPLYKAMMKDGALSFAMFFLTFLAHLAFCIYTAISPSASPWPLARAWCLGV